MKSPLDSKTKSPFGSQVEKPTISLDIELITESLKDLINLAIHEGINSERNCAKVDSKMLVSRMKTLVELFISENRVIVATEMDAIRKKAEANDAKLAELIAQTEAITNLAAKFSEENVNKMIGDLTDIVLDKIATEQAEQQ